MRVSTTFNRLLALAGVRVIDVSFAPEGVVVTVALRRRRAACSGCGQVFGGIRDRRLRRWRHLDLAGQRASSSTACAAYAAPTAASVSRPFPSRERAPATPATSRT